VPPGAWGGIDILVNNAGIQRDAPFVDMTLEQWNRVLSVNLTGMFLCARAAARVMVSQPERPAVSRAAGKIICVSSVHEAIVSSSGDSSERLRAGEATWLAVFRLTSFPSRDGRATDLGDPARVLGLSDRRMAVGRPSTRIIRTAAWSVISRSNLISSASCLRS